MHTPLEGVQGGDDGAMFGRRKWRYAVLSAVSADMARSGKPAPGEIIQAPTEKGNRLDVSVRQSRQESRIAEVLWKKGVCVCEGNRRNGLYVAAFDEAEWLWNQGWFRPPMQEMGAAEVEAGLWQRVLYSDEDQVVWLSEGMPVPRLMKLANQMKLIAAGIGVSLRGRTLGIKATGMWDAMLACYTGDRTYAFHLDNPHNKEAGSLPDNGLRLSICFFINPYLSTTDNYNGGGIDVFLTDPSKPPTKAEARKAKRLRIAPHADTMVAFYSQRMAHQVIETEGTERWYCLWLWTVDEQAVEWFPTQFLESRGLLPDIKSEAATPVAQDGAGSDIAQDCAGSDTSSDAHVSGDADAGSV